MSGSNTGDSTRDGDGQDRRDDSSVDRRDTAPADRQDDPPVDGEGGRASGAGADGAERLVGSRTGRHERLRSHPTPGTGNSLSHWPDARHPLRLTVNFLVVWVVRYSPSLTLKRWLLRRLGADVGAGVAFALTATPDVFWPELVTVEDHAIIGYDATLLCHEFLQDEYRTGEVHVGERAMVGADAVVLPGVSIGADAQVAANSMVTEDVPPGVTVAGVPATPVDDD